MKLQQKIATALCAFYLISVIGVALSLHFCGGQLSSVHFTKAASCKGCKAAEKSAVSTKCCKNSNIDAKVKDSHETGTKVNICNTVNNPAAAGSEECKIIAGWGTADNHQSVIGNGASSNNFLVPATNLVRIMNFSETGNYPRPIVYGMGAAKDMEVSSIAPAPEIAAGENKVTSNVSISYEIK